MRRSSASRCAKWRAILSGLVLLSPFAAAQAQKLAPAPSASPAKPQKPAATTAQLSAAGPKGAQAPDAIPEEGDFLKEREQWFLGDRTLPDGSVAAGMRQRALKHVDQMIEVQGRMGLLPLENAAPLATDFPGSPTWTSIGPRPINVGSSGFFPFNGSPSNSGRVAALAVDPRNPDVAFLGAAAGGVWKTIDGGLNWAPMTDNQPSLSSGSIALDPSSCSPAPPAVGCQTIYVGTGEQNFSGDSYYGAGVLKSTDGGTTWTQQGANVFLGAGGGPFSSSRLDGGAHIGTIAVDPFNHQIVLAGVSRFSSPAASGIYRTSDGGTTWTGPLTMAGATGGAAGTAIVFDPVTSGVVYATLGGPAGAAVNGVYRSTDDGATWTKMIGTAANPFPTANVGRIDIDLARSTPDTLFALVAKADGTGQLGLWKTSNASSGANADWIQQTSTPDFCTSTGGSQCNYDLIIRVSPNNPNVLFAGGSTGDSQAVPFNSRALFRSLNGGTNWVSVANGATTGLHVDLHALAFSGKGNRLYIGNDGGVWRFDNPGGNVVDYTNLNTTLAITMSYPGHGVHFSDENIMFVGTQDNGSQRYSGALAWDIVTGGDGTYTAIDPSVPSTVYTGCEFICIFRSLTDGISPSSFVQKTNGINPSDRANFVAPLIHDPSIANRIYFGTFRIWLSTNAGENWTAISPDLTTGTSRTITSIAVARSDSNVVYAGTTAGSASASRISKTTNALAGTGSNWTDVSTPALPSGRTVTAIAVDPHNPSLAYATYSGFSGFVDTLGHVFRTTDGGTTWQDISGTGAAALPNVPVNDILLDDIITGAAYVATDVGVFRSADASLGPNTVWTPVLGLPRVVVLSLNTRGRSRIVRASTSGRGTWIIQDTNVPVPAGPFLSSIRPTSVQAGSTTAVTLTAVDGANFTSNSRVQWDGSQVGVTTTPVSANKLTATLDPSLLTTANVGVHQITVVDGANTSDFLRFSVLGAAPSITSLVPSSAIVGGPGFNLQVNGTGFNCSPTQGVGSIVLFRGVTHTPLTSPPCSPTQMTVAIAASEIATGGNGNATVFTPPPAGGSSNPPFSFPITGPRPPNDDFANAISASSNFTDTEDSSGATTQAGEPVPACTTGQSSSTKSIWYKFTAPANGNVTADTNGTAYDSVLQAVTGTLGNFTSVACADLNGVGQGETVTFTATAGVTYFFMVSDFNGSGGATVFHLTASTTSGPAVALSPTSVPFGNQNLGATTATTNIQITNSGTLTLNITSITKTGANPGDFNLVAPAGGATPACPTGASSLAAGSKCFLGVNFAPTVTGARAADVSVTDDAPGSPQTVPLTGTGTSPAVALSAPNVAFGNVNMGDSKAATPAVTLTNSGTGPLAITAINITGADAAQFTQTNTCGTLPATIAPNGTCAITPTFRPTSIGAKNNASVSITDDASGSPQSVSLTGNGIDFTISGAPAALTVPAGQPANFTINLTTTGGATANATTFSASGNPAATTVTFIPASMSAGTTGSTTMTITTTARSAAPPQGPANPQTPTVLLLWVVTTALALMSLPAVRQGSHAKPYAVYLLPILLLVLVAFFSGCGGGGSQPPSGTPPGTSTITVTATSGSVSRTATVTLTVN